MKKLLLCLALILCAVPAHAQVFKFYAGGNAIWFDGSANLPDDVELGGTGRASLSPHISIVGSTFLGLQESYGRGSFGVRVTSTDVNNPDFSVGFGMERQFSSEPSIRPEEWDATASMGYRPWPNEMPRLILGAQGAYGLDSQQVSLIAGIRVLLGGL